MACPGSLPSSHGEKHPAKQVRILIQISRDVLHSVEEI